jgi:pimeloyl-ACP methyl ester carboxylesterase
MKRFLRSALFGVLVLALSACSSIDPGKFQDGYLAKHVITVSERGVANVFTNGGYRHDPVRRGKPKHGAYPPGAPGQARLDFPGPLQKQYEADLKLMFANIKAHAPVGTNGKKQILIFAHGGLNTENARLKRIEELIGLGEGDPANKITNYYPVFINWESGLGTSYGEHLISVRAGRKYESWGPVGWPLAPFVFIADIGKSVAKTPGVWIAQLTTDVKAAGYRTTAVKNSDRLYEQWNFYWENGLNGVDAWHGVTNCGSRSRVVWDMTSYALTVPFKLVAAPFIDGFGQSAWENMYRRTETMFHSVYEFDLSFGNRGSLTHGVPIYLDHAATGATAQFLDGLKKNLNTNEFEITLVGHSAGTIVLNKVLQRYPDLPYKRITYMAAACAISELEGSLIPVMKRQTNTTFLNWCLNPRAELSEKNAGDLAPRGSLLEWIDNFLGAPRTATDRTLGKWENIMQSAHVFPPEIQSRVEIVAADYQRRCVCPSRCETCEDEGVTHRCDPQKHGEFGRQKFWDQNKRREGKVQAF